MSTWIEAISQLSPTEAHMIQGYLESEGLETTLKDEFISQVYNFPYSNPMGGVKVMVKEEDFEAALQLLEKGGYLQPEKPEKIVEVVYRTNTTNTGECPFCHSENIGIKMKRMPDMLKLLALGAIFLLLKKKNVCYDCGKEWVYKRKKE